MNIVFDSLVCPLMPSQNHTAHFTPEDALSSSLWKTLNYFDVFAHPLMLHEIISFIDHPGPDREEVRVRLNSMIRDGFLNEYEGYYYLGDDRSKIGRRIEANVRACRKMKTARFFSRIISWFPYTRAVMISGSLSKGVMHSDSDIDFFVITRRGRLWLNRTMLAIFKKIFLLNSHKNFCINYFIDEEHLGIPDRNIFTATEVAFLMPMSNYPLHREFLNANNWFTNHYPNINTPLHRPDKQPWIRRFSEFLFNNAFGDWLEKQCMLLNNNYWKRKYQIPDTTDPNADIYSTPYTSKYHPHRQQFRVLNQLQQRLNGGI